MLKMRALLVGALLLGSASAFAAGLPPIPPPAPSPRPTSTCGDASHALAWDGSAYTCQVISGGTAAAGGSTTQLQRNNGGAIDGISGATSDGTSITITSGNLKLNGATSGTAVLNAPATGGGTLTLPAGTDTVVSRTSTDTLANKTLTAPVMTAPVLGTPASGTLTNATGLPISTGVSGLGTGVATALGTNVGSAGAPVVNGGALGTPSSGTLTNATGLPISTGVSGLGTGVGTALGTNVGSAGAPVVNGGALGTPSSGTLTNATGLPISTGVSGLGTGVAAALAIAKDTTGGVCTVGGTGCPAGSGGTAGNPTATAGPTANNGSATTYMRSDASPAVQKGTNSQFGIVEGDGTTIDCASTTGVCSVIGNTLAGTTQTVTANQWLSCSTFQVKTAGQTLTLPVSTSLAAGGCIIIQTQGQSVTLAPNAADALNSGTAGASGTIASGLTALVTKDAATANNLIVTPTTAGGSGTVTTTGSPASGNLAKFSGATSVTNADLTGDVTTSGGVATTIANNAVTTAKINNAAATYAKIQNGSSNGLLGVNSGAAPSEVAIGSGLSLSGGTLSATGGGSSVTPNWITGLKLATNTSSSISITAGNASDSTNAASMTTSSTFYGSVSGAWASGAGSSGSPTNKMGNGLTVANGTWYFVCMANNAGTPDFWFDTSSSCANRPSGISDTKYRVIGMFRTCTSVLCSGGASTSIAPFTSIPSPGGMTTLWNFDATGDGVDVNNGSLSSQTRALATLSVPTGFKVKALFSFTDNGSGTGVRVMSPDEADLTVGASAASNLGQQAPDVIFGSTGYYRMDFERLTNTSAQVAIRASGAVGAYTIISRGYEWDRGMNGQ